MRLGSSTFWWKDDPLVPEMFDQLAEAGVQDVEIADYHPNFNYFNAAWLRRMGQAARNAGLRIATVHTHLRHLDPELVLMHPDALRRRRAVEAYFRVVDALAILGADCLLTHDVQLGSETTERSGEREWTAAAMRDVADAAAAANVDVAVENLARGWSARVANLAEFVRTLGHPQVKMCFDVAHADREDDPVTALTSVVDTVGVLHINDAVRDRNHLLPGEGGIDWTGVMAALGEGPRDVRFIYELSNPAEIRELKRNFDWLQSLTPINPS